jgi:hypothetical protein
VLTSQRDPLRATIAFRQGTNPLAREEYSFREGEQRDPPV